MYCTHCGKQIDSVSYACMYCGALVNEEVKPQKIKKKVSGKAIGSMVLSFLALLFSIVGLIITLITFKDYGDAGFWEVFLTLGKMFFAFIIVLIPIILASISFGLAILDMGESKNGVNITGLLVSIISFIMCIVEIVIILVR